MCITTREVIRVESYHLRIRHVANLHHNRRLMASVNAIVETSSHNIPQSSAVFYKHVLLHHDPNAKSSLKIVKETPIVNQLN